MRKKKIFLLVLFALIFASPFHAHALDLVPCKDNCNLCDIISGMKRIFDYLGLIIVAAATLFIIIAGFLYIFSSGSKNLMELAKKAFFTCLAGFLLYHFSWLVVDAILKATGYNKVTSWWQFDCEGSADVAGGESKSAGKEEAKKTETKCDEKNKKLESIKVQCAEKDFKLEGDGTGFYVVLDTISGDGKGKTKQLKAIAKYNCDGTASEEDVTAQAEWKASDETQIKVAKGVVTAVTTSLGSSSGSAPYVEAKFQEKNSNQAKVYINSCPNTTAEAETENKFSSKFGNLSIPKVNAGTGITYDNTGCKSCGEANTCRFVEGNENGAKYIFILMRRNDILNGATIGSCTTKQEKWVENDTSDLKTFESKVKDFAKGYKYLNDTDGHFAIYKSTLIGANDSNCPPGKKYYGYGYIYKGTGNSASNSSQGSEYCIDAPYADRSFAHEQPGHDFAQLEDEYTASGENPNLFRNSLNLNCTADPKCTKWVGKKDTCALGCQYTEYAIKTSDNSKVGFYRPSKNSMMNKNYSASSFDTLNLWIIHYKAKNGYLPTIVPTFPGGPPNNSIPLLQEILPEVKWNQPNK